MLNSGHIVVDTNVIISQFLLPESIPGRAFSQANHAYALLFSKATMEELLIVIYRKKFDRYISLEDRKSFIERIAPARYVPIGTRIRACRDPKNDKFLEVALNGGAGLILTGDKDLLALGSFREIAMVSPEQYLLNYP